jgi:hypothetical protein
VEPQAAERKSETKGPVTTRFLMREMLAKKHVHKKLQGLLEPASVGTIHYESTQVCTQDEIKLFQVLFNSGAFVYPKRRDDFQTELVTNPRQLYLNFSTPSTKARQLAKVDFESMRWWWNAQVMWLHSGQKVMLTRPIEIEQAGVINPQFTTAELTKLGEICVDNVLLKNQQFLKMQAVVFASKRASELQTAAGDPGPSIQLRHVSPETAAARSIDISELTLLNQVASAAGGASGECILCTYIFRFSCP